MSNARTVGSYRGERRNEARKLKVIWRMLSDRWWKVGRHKGQPGIGMMLPGKMK